MWLWFLHSWANCCLRTSPGPSSWLHTGESLDQLRQMALSSLQLIKIHILWIFFWKVLQGWNLIHNLTQTKGFPDKWVPYAYFPGHVRANRMITSQLMEKKDNKDVTISLLSLEKKKYESNSMQIFSLRNVSIISLSNNWVLTDFFSL